MQKIVEIQCFGKTIDGNPALAQAIPVGVTLTKRQGSAMISTDVFECPYNTGSHGQRCIASHPQIESGTISCPYSFDLLEGFTAVDYQPPTELLEAIGELKAEEF